MKEPPKNESSSQLVDTQLTIGDEVPFRCFLMELRRAILLTNIPHEYSSTARKVTISVGIATGWVNDEKDFIELFEVADQAIYNAILKAKTE